MDSLKILPNVWGNELGKEDEVGHVTMKWKMAWNKKKRHGKKHTGNLLAN